MKTYLNIESGLLTLAAGAATGIRRMDVKRGDLLELEVVTSAALDAGAVGVFAAKLKGIYSGGVLALDAAWEAPVLAGAGYLFALPLNTVPLDALFTGEIAEVVLMAEITFTSAGKTRSTQTFDLVVARDVWLGTEGAPSPVVAAPSFLLSAPDASQWVISITNDGQLVRTKI